MKNVTEKKIFRHSTHYQHVVRTFSNTVKDNNFNLLRPGECINDLILLLLTKLAPGK